MRRRTFLTGASVLTVTVAGGGVWRAYDQGVFSVGEGPAYELWKDGGRQGGSHEKCLRDAKRRRAGWRGCGRGLCEGPKRFRART